MSTEARGVVYVVRHGDYRRQFDSVGRELICDDRAPLSPAGVLQSAQIAHRILATDGSLNQIYHSPVRRAAKTARIIAAISKAPLRCSSDFSEREASSWTGKPRDELVAIDWELYSPEAWNQLINRTIRGFNNVQLSASGKVVTIVTHHDLAALMAYHVENPMGRPPSIGDLTKTHHLEPGQAWRMEFSSRQLVDRALIRSNIV